MVKTYLHHRQPEVHHVRLHSSTPRLFWTVSEQSSQQQFLLLHRRCSVAMRRRAPSSPFVQSASVGFEPNCRKRRRTLCGHAPPTPVVHIVPAVLWLPFGGPPFVGPPCVP